MIKETAKYLKASPIRHKVSFVIHVAIYYSVLLDGGFFNKTMENFKDTYIASVILRLVHFDCAESLEDRVWLTVNTNK